MTCDGVEAGRLAGSNRRICIVDDNPAIHEGFRKVLGAEMPSLDALAKSAVAFLGEAEPPGADVGFEMAAPNGAPWTPRRDLRMQRAAAAAKRAAILADVIIIFSSTWISETASAAHARNDWLFTPAYQRSSRGPSTAPIAAARRIPRLYQVSTKTAADSRQCRQ
jgi:hypothetical protein